jgi:hypothetical protein
MRRYAWGVAVLALAAGGCGGRSIYRNVGTGRAEGDPAVTRTSVEAEAEPAARGRFEPEAESSGGLIDANAAFGPRFSRGAVPDAEMLRNQSDAGYRDGAVPY